MYITPGISSLIGVTPILSRHIAPVSLVGAIPIISRHIPTVISSLIGVTPIMSRCIASVVGKKGLYWEPQIGNPKNIAGI